jgi:hypothetical protein
MGMFNAVRNLHVIVESPPRSVVSAVKKRRKINWRENAFFLWLNFTSHWGYKAVSIVDN